MFLFDAGPIRNELSKLVLLIIREIKGRFTIPQKFSFCSVTVSRLLPLQ